MFRRVTSLLARPIISAGRARSFSTDLPANPTADSAFVDAWKKVVPNTDPPKTPLAFMKPRPPTPSSIPSKLTVNFVLPYASELSAKEGFGLCYLGEKVAFSTKIGLVKKKMKPVTVCHKHPQPALEVENVSPVDMVIIPATTGHMGVLPGHVATIAELKPGVLSVHEGNDTTKYFISSGFAFIHANSYADIIAVEAVPLDQIDASLVQKGLAEFTQKLSSASTDLEKAEAQIGVDVHSALNSALTG
ncbi:hypothetical protein FEM48_Zijuj06G0211500 [Ziziphus jujuba var. spinosa]|uniref:ATP synthase F1 complex delta/epsilon subunit N-terminal domain-containing protein n=1 Tax=Ziziphus jujuba var. spinosa TaxID=714518 RepID=A0A978VBM7_ZIZJJ|nr:hypothetical protein FEM48_Zijuj06G0211500 [Ziziphus jujuba var. spinosa]